MYRPPNALNVFFEDVSKLPVVGGKNQYLPLTRRIERGRLLIELTKQNDGETLRQVQSEISAQLGKISALCSENASSDFIQRATGEIELFLDNSDWDAPPSVTTILSQIGSPDDHDQLREIGWRSFFLLALLPFSLRSDYMMASASEELQAHFRIVLEEYEQSKQALLEGTLRYAIRLARYYLHSGMPYLDLVQEGILGLLYSIDKFQEVAGAHFQSYAANWIQQRIRRYIADHSRLIRVPVHRHETTTTINHKHQELIDCLGHLPSEYQLFEAMEWLTEEDTLLIEKQKRYNALKRRLFEYRQLVKHRDQQLSKIPERVRQKVIDLDIVCEIITERLGSEPDELTLFQELGWFSIEEIKYLQEQKPQKAGAPKVAHAFKKLRKARIQMEHYQMANAVHHSLESIHIKGNPLEEYLVAPDDTEIDGDSNLLANIIQEVLARLGRREGEILNLRFGLQDGEEKTLEEIGQEFGVTRERIRQIEAKALRRLRHPSTKHRMAEFADQEFSVVSSVSDRLQQRLLQQLHEAEQDDYTEDQYIAKQQTDIDKMIEKYVMQGRSRTSARGPYGSRAQLFRHILEQAGEPLHYTAIHERALQTLPAELHYPKERTYATLFYRDIFQLLGNGMFGLANWDTASTSATGEQVLHHCPLPLLPSSDGRAFFESIMVGLNLFKRQPQLSADQFYAGLRIWAKEASNGPQAMQAAFDAWYAAGLLKRIDVLNGTNKALEPTIPVDAKLNDVRLHCLNSLCRRILKMPELLLTLKRIGRPVVPDIQKVLFGSERAGFDVPMRLNILASFEAVQRAGDEWRLTSIGEVILQANPPQELPDFSVIDEATAEDDTESADLDWDSELGLLDL